MTTTVAIRGRTYLPGSGISSAGARKQGKQMTWGRISVTDMTAAGEPLPASKVGLTTIDTINFSVVTNAGAPIALATHALIGYDYTNAAIVMVAVATAGGSGDELTALAGTEEVEINFQAIGDSAHDVELV